MSSATITSNTATLCNVAFDYDETSKEAVKALAGASFDGQVWIVPTMHLPTLKLIFITLTVAPEVVGAYHDLLKRLLTDAPADEFGLLSATLKRHAVGIAAVLKTGWKPTERPQRPLMANDAVSVAVVKSEPVSVSQEEEKAISLWLRGAKNAAANAEKKAHVAAADKRKRKKAA